MQVNYQGNRDAKIVLLQIIGEHELPLLEEELSHIKAITQSTDFLFITVKVDSWNDDLSPWMAEPIFGDAAFAGNAEKLLTRIKNEVIVPLLSEHQDIKIFAGGYSLAGLFVLWAAYQTNLFEGIAAVSPSVWFPKFVDFVHNNKILTNRVYLSLGDKEAKTRNKILAQVANDIRDVYTSLEDYRLSSILVWNQGNHFKEPALRMAKGFAWLMSYEKIHSYEFFLKIFEYDEVFLVDETLFYFDDEPKNQQEHYLGCLREYDKPYWVGYCDIPDGEEFLTAKEMLEAKIFEGKSIKDRWEHVVIVNIGGFCWEDWLDMYMNKLGGISDLK